MFQNKIGIILLFLFFLYTSQNVLYSGGNLFTQIVLVIIFLISSYYFIKILINKNKKSNFLKYWVGLLLLNIVVFVFTGTLSDTTEFGMLRGILISLLTFFPFYYLSQRGFVKAKHLIIFFIGSTIVLILKWTQQRQEIVEILGQEEVVNNMSYTLVFLLPFIFLFTKRKYLAYGLLVLIFYFVILGSKRGAIIVGSIPILFYLYGQIRLKNLKKNILGYLAGITAVSVVVFYSYKFFTENTYLLNRFQNLQEGDSSSRDDIYSNIFSNWANSDSIINLLFGYGFAGSREISGKGVAHNDWLELLSNFGVIGPIIYLLLFYQLFKYAYSLRTSSQNKLMLQSILLMWLATSFFSMGYVSNDGYFRSILLGFVLGIASQRSSNYSAAHFRTSSSTYRKYRKTQSAPIV